MFRSVPDLQNPLRQPNHNAPKNPSPSRGTEYMSGKQEQRGKGKDAGQFKTTEEDNKIEDNEKKKKNMSENGEEKLAKYSCLMTRRA